MTVNPHLSPVHFGAGEAQSSPGEHGPMAWTCKVYHTHTMPEAARGRASPHRQPVSYLSNGDLGHSCRIPAVAEVPGLSYHRGFAGPCPRLQLAQAFFQFVWGRSEASREDFFFFFLNIIIISLSRIGVSRFRELLLDINIQYQNAEVIYTHHWGYCCVVRQITQWSDVLGFFFFFHQSGFLVSYADFNM